MSDDTLESPWHDLVAADPFATVYSTLSFQRALFGAFGPAEPQVIALEAGGRIVGLMPIAALTMQRGKATLRETGFLRCAHTLRNTLLIPEGAASSGVLLEALLRAMPSDSLLFQNLPSDSGKIAQLQAAAARAGLHADMPQEGRLLMHSDFNGGYDAFWASLSGQQRRHFRKRRRNLEAKGELRLVRLTGGLITNSMQVWRDIVATSWQGHDAHAVGNKPQDWDFHRRLVDNGALLLLFLDDRPIASLRYLEHDNVAYLHTMNYNYSLREMSPGLVLFDFAVRDIATRGFRRLDFNGKTEIYKRCASGETSHQTLRIYRPTLRGHAARYLRRVLAH